MATQSNVAMNAVTTTNKNQCVDVINAGDANDIQMIPKTCNLEERKKKNISIKLIFDMSFLGSLVDK